MDAKQCDFCGKYFQSIEDNKVLIQCDLFSRSRPVRLYPWIKVTYNGRDDSLDICPECMRKMFETLKPNSCKFEFDDDE